jgi:hypothetical protein
MTSRRKSQEAEEIHALRQASIAAPYHLLGAEAPSAQPRLSLAILYHLPRHQGGASFVARILYHLRSFTRATRFACASTPFDERPEPHSGSLPTALIHPRRLLVGSIPTQRSPRDARA